MGDPEEGEGDGDEMSVALLHTLLAWVRTGLCAQRGSEDSFHSSMIEQGFACEEVLAMLPNRSEGRLT